MPWFTLALWLVGGVPASTPSFDLNLELTVGEHAPAKITTRVTPGRRTSLVRDLDDERVFVDVDAEAPRSGGDRNGDRSEDQGVVLRFVVGRLGPRDEREVLARPLIKAIEDERALLSENHVSIAVTARPH